MTKSGTPFTIPPPEIEHFKQIASTDIEQLERIASCLKNSEPRIDIKSFAREVASETDIPFEQSNKLISFLWRLLIVKGRYDGSLSEFIDDLSEALRELDESIWSDKEHKEWEKRRTIISELLATPGALGLSTKAAELLLEHPFVLCESRIISDLRPIFDDDADVILGFVNFHTLMLRCVEGGKEKILHIAMDNNDVSQLKEHAERAEKKVRMLDAELKAKDVNIIELEEKKKE